MPGLYPRSREAILLPHHRIFELEGSPPPGKSGGIFHPGQRRGNAAEGGEASGPSFGILPSSPPAQTLPTALSQEIFHVLAGQGAGGRSAPHPEPTAAPRKALSKPKPSGPHKHSPGTNTRSRGARMDPAGMTPGRSAKHGAIKGQDGFSRTLRRDRARGQRGLLPKCGNAQELPAAPARVPCSGVPVRGIPPSPALPLPSIPGNASQPIPEGCGWRAAPEGGCQH